ncbi:hypothetical protein SAMN05216241_10325 [Limimonas halophila]|uniref:N-acetyltransferase domain-containing protein n=1 Tax=Limimonas halophila TaxID=1082479 RepID=A0A1G7PQ89_9PROT|nr:hypothetical protein [Limimonas halophila]SDF88433.1 hypothetical protein SAMN05216241_10325 [Limimonas halophila]
MTAVERVSGGRAFRRFLRVPARIDGDCTRAPFLDVERKQHLGHGNPFFEHAEAQYFLATRDGAPVGRISAQLDRLAQPDDGPRVAHFGLLEGVDREALHALLAAAEGWARERGATRLAGPFSLSINDEVGLRVDGFERPVRMLMNDAPQWYGPAVEAAGFDGVQDLIAYDFDPTQPLPRRARRMAEQTAAEPNVHERPINPRQLHTELRTIIDIFNDAWADNWGFVPMTPAEVGALVSNLRPLIKPDMVRIAEIDGEPAAMIVALPDLNEALQGLDGRLLPFGWAKLLWRLKVRGLSSGRVLLMGVRRAYRDSPVGRGLPLLLIQRLHAVVTPNHGITDLELSWILDDNWPTRRVIETVGGVAAKRYRVYAKDIA